MAADKKYIGIIDQRSLNVPPLAEISVDCRLVGKPGAILLTNHHEAIITTRSRRAANLAPDTQGRRCSIGYVHPHPMLNL